MVAKKYADIAFLGCHFCNDNAPMVAYGPIDDVSLQGDTWYLRHRNGSFTFLKDSVMNDIVTHGWADRSTDASCADIIRPIYGLYRDYECIKDDLLGSSLFCDLGEEIEMKIQSVEYVYNSNKYEVVVEYDENEYLCNLDFLNPEYQGENNSPKQILTKTIYFTRDELTLLSKGYIIFGETPNTAYYLKSFFPNGAQPIKETTSLNLSLIKNKYTCVEIEERMASCPKDVGIITISNEENGYMGAIQTYKNRLYYVARGLDGKRWFRPILTLDDIEFYAKQLKTEYEKVGVELKTTTDFGDYNNVVFWRIRDFLLSIGATEHRSFGDGIFYKERITFLMCNVRAVTVDLKNGSVFIINNITNNDGVYTNSILDGIKYISSVLSDFCDKVATIKQKLPWHLYPFHEENSETASENENVEVVQ